MKIFIQTIMCVAIIASATQNSYAQGNNAVNEIKEIQETEASILPTIIKKNSSLTKFVSNAKRRAKALEKKANRVEKAAEKKIEKTVQQARKVRECAERARHTAYDEHIEPLTRRSVSRIIVDTVTGVYDVFVQRFIKTLARMVLHDIIK